MAGNDNELLLDPAVQRDPFPHYRRLREHDPVLRMPDSGFYVLTRYEDVRAVLRDTETFSNTLDLADLSGERARRLGASAVGKGTGFDLPQCSVERAQ